MNDDQHNETREQGRVTQPIAPTARRSDLQSRESETRKQISYAQVRKRFDHANRWIRMLGKDFRRRLYRAPFVLELLGVLVVGAYAFAAHEQNILIAQTVAQQVLSNRPVMYHAGVDWSEKTPDGVPKKVKVNWQNFGKSLAITVVTAGHIFIRSAGDPPPVDSDCDENRVELPKSGRTDAVAPGAMAEPHWGLTEGEELSDFKSGGKVLYVSGCVYYFGIDAKLRYFSDLCVVWAPHAAQDFRTCDESNRNYAR